MKPSALGRPFLRTLPLIAGAAVLMVGIACGGAETPAAAPTAAPAAATQAPAMAQLNTPIPEAADATVRPTNTPAPTAAPRVAATLTPSAGPQYGGLLKMSAYADTKDWDPLGSASLSSVISYSQLYNQLVQYDTVDTSAVTGDLAEHGTSAPTG